MTDSEFLYAVANARKRVSDMDKTDGRKDRELTTILAALEAGIRNPKTHAQFDAFVMIQDLVK